MGNLRRKIHDLAGRGHPKRGYFPPDYSRTHIHKFHCLRNRSAPLIFLLRGAARISPTPPDGACLIASGEGLERLEVAAKTVEVGGLTLKITPLRVFLPRICPFTEGRNGHVAG